MAFDTLQNSIDLADDDRSARQLQPMASVLGPRVLDWQLKRPPEEAWPECDRNARVLSQPPAPRSPVATPEPSTSITNRRTS